MAAFHLDSTVIVAIIAATASIIAALIAGFVAYRTARSGRSAAIQLEEQKARLSNDLAEESAHRAQVAAERDARRDYEYEAKKRLYEEIEPLLFQLYESLGEAHYRVRSLARSSRHGNLPDWLGPRTYYVNSSAYKLILPAVYLRLIQREMTFVDLRVDETIRIRYSLMKCYSRSFTDDFDFAKTGMKLEYDPNNKDWPNLVVTAPEIYVRQGLVLGTLENICDTLILAKADHGSRVMSYGEFEESVKKSRGILPELVALLENFSPSDRPILSRMLIAQAVLAQLIALTYRETIAVTDLPRILDEILTLYRANRVFAWHNADDLQSLAVADAYLQKRFQWMLAGDRWVEGDE